MAKIIWRGPEAVAAQTSASRQASGMGGGSGRATSERERESDFKDSPIEKPTEDDKLEVCHEGAWYEAKLTRRGQRVRVSYVEYANDREFWDVSTIQQADPLRNLVRVVSPQLQDAECGAISVNTTVCALRKSEDEEGWYDAVIKEVGRRIHGPNGDGGEVCTCSFTVVWLSGPDKDRVEKHLRCEHLCRLSDKDVCFHPVILEILHSCNQQEFQDGELCTSESHKSRRAGQGARSTREVDNQSKDSLGESSKRRLSPSSEQNELSPIGDVGDQQQAAKKPHLQIDTDIACHSQRPDIFVDQTESESKVDFISGDQQKSCSGIDIGTGAVLKGEVCHKQESTVPAESEFNRYSGHLKSVDAECIPHVFADSSTRGSRSSTSNESCDLFRDALVTPKVIRAHLSQDTFLPSEEQERVLGKHVGHCMSTLNEHEDTLCCAGETLAELINDYPDPNDKGIEKNMGLGKEREAPGAKLFRKEDFLSKNIICLSDDDDFEKQPLSSVSSKLLFSHVKGVNKQCPGQIGSRKAISEHMREHPGCVLMIDNLEMDVTRVQIMHLLLNFCQREKIHSIYIPFPYYIMTYAVGYVVFMDKETADTAGAFMIRNLVVSSHGRPWSVRSGGHSIGDRLSCLPAAEFTDFDEFEVNCHFEEKLKILTPNNEKYGVSMARLKLFLIHRRQTQNMYEKQDKEEMDVEYHPIFQVQSTKLTFKP